jgi:hypothetical protein
MPHAPRQARNGREREHGPILLGAHERRLDRHATYIVSTFEAGASR